MSKKPLNRIREMYGLPRIENKYDLDGVCQDCVYLKKIRPLFDEKDKEIERLNNIINSMEKFFKYELEEEVRPLNDFKVSVWTICLDKLQELKGDSSNE